MSNVTTIKIKQETKSSLDSLREYKAESYDEVIKKLVHIIQTLETEPKLSKQALKEIKQARKRVSQGIYVDEADALKRLGIDT